MNMNVYNYISNLQCMNDIMISVNFSFVFQYSNKKNINIDLCSINCFPQPLKYFLETLNKFTNKNSVQEKRKLTFYDDGIAGWKRFCLANGNGQCGEDEFGDGGAHAGHDVPGLTDWVYQCV